MRTEFKKMFLASDVEIFQERTVEEYDFLPKDYDYSFYGEPLEAIQCFGDLSTLTPEFAITINPTGQISMWYLHNKKIVTTLGVLNKTAALLAGDWSAKIRKVENARDRFCGARLTGYHITVIVGKNNETVVDIIITNPHLDCEVIMISQ